MPSKKTTKKAAPKPNVRSTGVTMFTTGATAARQRLLKELTRRDENFTFVGFSPGQPGVFTVAVYGQEIKLTLGQVELFVAGYRMRAACQPLDDAGVHLILTHQFAD